MYLRISFLYQTFLKKLIRKGLKCLEVIQSSCFLNYHRLSGNYLVIWLVVEVEQDLNLWFGCRFHMWRYSCVDILPCSMSKITQQEINCEFSFSSLTLSIFTLQPLKLSILSLLWDFGFLPPGRLLLLDEIMLVELKMIRSCR